MILCKFYKVYISHWHVSFLKMPYKISSVAYVINCRRDKAAYSFISSQVSKLKVYVKSLRSKHSQMEMERKTSSCQLLMSLQFKFLKSYLPLLWLAVPSSYTDILNSLLLVDPQKLVQVKFQCCEELLDLRRRCPKNRMLFGRPEFIINEIKKERTT